MIEGVDDFKRQLEQIKTGKETEVEKTKVFIKSAGVYKFEAKAG